MTKWKIAVAAAVSTAFAACTRADSEVNVRSVVGAPVTAESAARVLASSLKSSFYLGRLSYGPRCVVEIQGLEPDAEKRENNPVEVFIYELDSDDDSWRPATGKLIKFRLLRRPNQLHSSKVESLQRRPDGLTLKATETLKENGGAKSITSELLITSKRGQLWEIGIHEGQVGGGFFAAYCQDVEPATSDVLN